MEASIFGYSPPVLALASGDAVVWASTDATHVQRDGLNAGDAAWCFSLAAEGGEATEPVTFALADGELFANGVACANARVSPDGARATLPYFCTLHGTMRGLLVVSA